MSHWTIDSIPSFCITLERRQDRWRRFQDQPGIDGLNLKKFIGVDGKTIDIKNDERVTTLTKRNILTKSRRSHEELDSIGGVGCALSHIGVWKWMVDNNQDLCLIFEDDAVVPDSFIHNVNGCIDKSIILKNYKNWDLWLLGGKWGDLSRIPNEPHAVRIGEFALFHAYVLTLHGAKRLLKDAYPIHCHIDIWVSIYSYLNDLRIVGCTDLMLEQTQRVKTDIQSDKGCQICNVPTDFDTNYKMITKTEWYISQTSKVISLGLITYFIYKKIIEKN